MGLDDVLHDLVNQCRQLNGIIGMVNDNVRALALLLMLAFVMILVLLWKTIRLRKMIERLDKKFAEHLAADPRYYHNPQRWSDQL